MNGRRLASARKFELFAVACARRLWPLLPGPTRRAVEVTEPFLPANQPRYAMGLGTPAQMVELVARGVDMFDCVLPTRVARNGTAFTRKGSISIKAGAYKADFRPIEEDCDCFACRNFTRSHARYVFARCSGRGAGHCTR